MTEIQNSYKHSQMNTLLFAKKITLTTAKQRLVLIGLTDLLIYIERHLVVCCLLFPGFCALCTGICLEFGPGICLEFGPGICLEFGPGCWLVSGNIGILPNRNLFTLPMFPIPIPEDSEFDPETNR